MSTSYQKAFKNTKSVVKVYLELAKLEKNGKLKSKIYQDMFSLLEHMISVENYEKVKIDDSIVSEEYQKAIKEQLNGNFFLDFDSQVLISMRFSNQMDSKHLYTLNGCIEGEVAKKLQGNFELSFYNEINCFMNQERLEKDAKNHLIDFKYALLATSPSVEKNVLLGETFLPFTSEEMCDEELAISKQYFYSIVSEITTYLFSILDADINSETLPIVLYAKACLKMLPSYITKPFLDTKRNLISAHRLLGKLNGVSRDKIADMLTYLLGESSNEKVKK